MHGTDSYDIFAQYSFDLPANAQVVLENLQHKVVVIGGRKNKMLFVDPLLEQALLWSRQAMSLKEKKLSETFGKRASYGYRICISASCCPRRAACPKMVLS